MNCIAARRFHTDRTAGALSVPQGESRCNQGESSIPCSDFWASGEREWRELWSCGS